MYLPPQFKAEEQAHAAQLMREHPFAMLPESHTAMRSVYATGNAKEQALGRWMDQLGLA